MRSRTCTATPELLYVHADHLSRPIRLTDAAKVTAWAVEWLPWGGVHSISGSETLNARFPGQWFQVESGLHYNWHRHYDPSIGRYTQPDPLGFVDGPSVYAYARNAPGESVDPEGNSVWGWPVVRTAAAACYRTLFAQSSGWLNANRYLRLGEGRKGGEVVFRAVGSVVERFTGRKHIDFWWVRSLNK